MPLVPGTLPSGACYGTPQELLDLFAQYLDIPQFAVSSKVLYSATSPFPNTDFIWIDTAGGDTPIVKFYNETIGAYEAFPFAGGASSGNEQLIQNQTVLGVPIDPADYFLISSLTGGSFSKLRKITFTTLATAVAATVVPANGSITAPMLSGAQTGSAPIYAARAWVNFNPQQNSSGVANTTPGTNRFIRASGNVSSVVYVSTGVYDVNFTTAMSDTSYSTQCTTSNNADGDGQAYEGSGATKLTTKVRVCAAAIATGAVSDPQSYHVLVIR